MKVGDTVIDKTGDAYVVIGPAFKRYDSEGTGSRLCVAVVTAFGCALELECADLSVTHAATTKQALTVYAALERIAKGAKRAKRKAT